MTQNSSYNLAIKLDEVVGDMIICSDDGWCPWIFDPKVLHTVKLDHERRPYVIDLFGEKHYLDEEPYLYRDDDTTSWNVLGFHRQFPVSP